MSFSVQPSANDFERMLAFNMLAPRHVRVACRRAPTNYEPAFSALRIPVLVTHGEYDQVLTLALARYSTELIPGATLSVYERIGHSPFWEDAPRFNVELADLCRRADAGRGLS
jgi:pimeloyl-ACP methyl ester carboxylesterase